MFYREPATAYMRDNDIDAWLLYDFRGSNLMFWHILGVEKYPTRRAYMLVRPEGDPLLIIHTVDQFFFHDVTLKKVIYKSWTEVQGLLREMLSGVQRLAMEYSPGNTVPMVGWADAGTVEMMRDWGFEVVSSADLFQVAASAWDDHAFASHVEACALVAGIKDAAFDLVGQRIRRGEPITEYGLQQFIFSEFARLGLETQGAPVVQCNEHSGMVHYEPLPEGSLPIGRGDWLLIDFWARKPGIENVYSDIAWGAYAGDEIPPDLQRIFDIVVQARDAALATIQAAWDAGTPLEGWQVDRAARDLIASHGHGDEFNHRTGHSMGPGRRNHALGVNLDDFETHDTRRLMPRTGFSIEPAIYTSRWGMRSEINVFMDPETGPKVITPLQYEIVRMA